MELADRMTIKCLHHSEEGSADNTQNSANTEHRSSDHSVSTARMGCRRSRSGARNTVQQIRRRTKVIVDHTYVPELDAAAVALGEAVVPSCTVVFTQLERRLVS